MKIIHAYFENKSIEINNTDCLWGFNVGDIVTSDSYGILYQKKCVIEGGSMDYKENFGGELFPRQILWVTIIDEKKTIGFIQPRILRRMI